MASFVRQRLQDLTVGHSTIRSDLDQSNWAGLSSLPIVVDEPAVRCRTLK
jgi:hypothetical protein